jgi:hypothetical protein
MPVVMMLPFLKAILKVVTRPFKRSIEFLQVCLLRALHLAIEMRGTRSVRPEFYAIVAVHFLDLDGEELTPSICLNSLDWERHLIDELLKEVDSIFRSTAWIYRQYAISGAVIYSCVLIEPITNLAGIHLHSITGNRPFISLDALSLQADNWFNRMLAQNLMNGIERQGAIMVSFEFILDPSRSKVTFLPQTKNPFFLLVAYLPGG